MKKPALTRPTELDPPFPSSPSLPPRYVLYCYNFELDRTWITNTYGLYAAHKIVDLLSEGQQVMVQSATLIVAGHIRVSSYELPEILSHKYTDIESRWQLPDNIELIARQFARKNSEPVPWKKPIEVTTVPVKTGDVVTGASKQPAKIVSVTNGSSARNKPVDELADRIKMLTDAPGGFNTEAVKKLAVLNGVWKDDYAKLSNGLMRMSVVNRLRSEVKKGTIIKWPK